MTYGRALVCYTPNAVLFKRTWYKARRRAEAARDVRPSDRGLLVLLLRRRR
jgi:hypothetical protein